MRTLPLIALTLVLGVAAARPVAAQPPQPLPPVPVPAGNPITPAKASLGKALFWDEQLSSTRTISCGTCHIPSAGGSDPRSALAGSIGVHPGFDGTFGTDDDVRGSPGVPSSLALGTYVPEASFGVAPQVTGRKTPSMINAAFSPLLFWDGRATGTFADPVSGATVLTADAALESQAVAPPVSAVEMAHADRDWNDVAARTAESTPLALAASVPAALDAWIAGRSYPQLFQEAFGTPQVTPARIAMALATYQRTLISDDAPVDQPPPGPGNPPPLTQLEAQGRNVFNGPGRCVLCHGGPLFTDHQFRNIGVRPIFEDLGRGAVTGLPIHDGRFKTPSLRNVGLRAPYFHDGSKATLMDVVEFYDRGGDFHVNQSPLIIPLGLTPQQKTALVAFLEGALTDPRVAQELPPFDRPTLYSESEHVPETYGPANPGTGGAAPRWVAVEPPAVGNPNLALAIDRGLGGAFAFLGLDVGRAAPGTDVGGVPIHLALSPAVRFFPFPLLGTGAGGGWTSFAAAVPDQPALDGASIDLQVLIADAAAPGGFSSTPGLELTFFDA